MLTAEPQRATWRQRARSRVQRGWYWAADYRYVLRRHRAWLDQAGVPESYRSGSRRPVVLIAGVMEPWILLKPVADRLNAAGHPVHVVPDLAYNLGAIPEAAEMVYQAIVERDLWEVVVVAHSKGGLIGKYLLVNDDQRRIDQLIAIATPFAGSSLARLIPLRSIRSLRPGDATIRDLAVAQTVNAQITSIYPSFDPHVPDGSHLHGAVNIELPAMGHFRILSDQQALEAVEAAADRPSVSRGADTPGAR